MHAAILMLSLYIGEQPEPLWDTRSVELIEINRYYCNKDGSGGNMQVIYWDRGWDGERHVKHWRFLTKPIDITNDGLGQGFSEWITINNREFRIRAWCVIESWSTYCPELEDRKAGQEWRRDLFK